MSHKLTVLPYLIKFTPKIPINSTQVGAQTKDNTESDTINESNTNELKINIYGFDLDHTVIKPKSPNSRFARSSTDWQFMTYSKNSHSKSTLQTLFEIVKNDPLGQIVIFSNQGGIVAIPPTSKSCIKFTDKVQLFLKAISEQDVEKKLINNIWIYAAPKQPASLFKSRKLKSATIKGKVTKSLNVGNESISKSTSTTTVLTPELFDSMRKPNIGMFKEFEKDFKLLVGNISTEIKCTGQLVWIYYCGDAAGRSNDFSDSDKKFAKNCGVDFKTPEEIF
ncbi:polynucleotide 3'-phosphatase NDAI_0H03130 [Naumovozyma dairenensis CBS 421]|uniref:DNA 3'-phosphatase n=1 Tax=Naumovozyma dairenensis (strain ATCC 10597 / BCRC 20456 / CBS 421 / NBRC 0211 / NRRL Y-12639) TaxID=1071378 RepID=G0WFC5_NAUDC|nr:hypothetical protein NDAI_0H03130 [Naumovozyma dairenensis CBS 421]CCD26486.1 hypothetical protein NDAI_0H03130 [Naumovozyma dairenensis CBS 421]